MTRETRRKIFYALVALFLVLGTSIVLYAEGWRVNGENFEIERVGGIFVRAFPADAAITLDGKPVPSRPGILSRGTLISDIFPRSHALTLAEQGYDQWKETVMVLPSTVTQLKNAVLVPDGPSGTSTTTVKNFSLAAGAPIFQTATGAIIANNAPVARGALIASGPDEEFFSNDALFQDAATGRYFRYDAAANTSTDLSALFLKNGISPANFQTVALDPFDPSKIFALGFARAWLLDMAEDPAVASVIAAAPRGTRFGTALAIAPNAVAWTDFGNASSASAISAYDFGARVLSTSSSALPGRVARLAWVNGSLFAALGDDGTLSTYDTGTDQFKKMASGVKNFAAAPDGSAIATIEESSLEVFPFADSQTYHRFNLPGVSNATALAWYRDGNHLFVEAPGFISLLDLDDLALTNFAMVASTAPGAQALYSPSQNVLYVVNPASKLEWFDFPS